MRGIESSARLGKDYAGEHPQEACQREPLIYIVMQELNRLRNTVAEALDESAKLHVLIVPLPTSGVVEQKNTQTMPPLYDEMLNIIRQTQEDVDALMRRIKNVEL